MTFVATAITWASHEAELKSYLGVSGSSEDAKLELWLDAITSEADRFIDGGPLHEDDTADLDAEWSMVKLGVWEAMKRWREAQELRPDLVSVKTDDLTETYSTGRRITTTAGALMSVAHHFYKAKGGAL